jgi:hypothetical protein
MYQKLRSGLKVERNKSDDNKIVKLIRDSPAVQTIESIRVGPAKARFFGPPHVLGHRTPSDPLTDGDLAGREAAPPTVTSKCL